MAEFTELQNDSSGLSLAVRLQEDSVDAWTDLVELYGPLVKSWACRSGIDGATAEDIAQEVFASVHRSISRFDANQAGATFRGWLWTITRNSILQSRRRQVPQAFGGSTANAKFKAQVDPLADPLSEFDPPSSAADTSALLDRAMQQIRSRVDPITWKAFVLTTVEGKSATEVAESLGTTSAAVRKAKSRTLQRLRKQLGDVV